MKVILLLTICSVAAFGPQFGRADESILVEHHRNFVTSKVNTKVKAPSVAADIPPDVLAAVKAAKLTKYGETIDETPKAYSNQIVKFEYLTINARGRLRLTNLSVPWIAIVAKNINIENAPTLADKAVIERPTDAELASLVNGKNGQNYPTAAPSGGEDSGNPGSKGAEGIWGGDGTTVNMPTVFFFFENINVATQQPPAGGVHVRLVVDGPKGGDGGNAGNGQNGGTGGRGTPSRCTMQDIPFDGSYCTECKAGPGDGGQGGQGGTGGRGGAAAAGGKAATVWFIGPQPSLTTTGYFGVSQKGGSPGRNGNGGQPGSPGGGAGGGYQCKCCPNGGGSKGSGPQANPPTLGPGPTSSAVGKDGDTIRIPRDNSDLWM